MDLEWMDSGRPMILAGETDFGGRVVYFASDIDRRLYRQADRFLLYLVNLSGANRNPGFLDKEHEVGPFETAIFAQEFLVERAAARSRGERPCAARGGLVRPHARPPREPCADRPRIAPHDQAQGGPGRNAEVLPPFFAHTRMRRGES